MGSEIFNISSGVSIPRDRTEQNKAENDLAYALSQEQRALERKIRYAERRKAMFEAAGDTKGVEKAKKQIEIAGNNMANFIKNTGRTRRKDREKIYKSA